MSEFLMLLFFIADKCSLNAYFSPVCFSNNYIVLFCSVVFAFYKIDNIVYYNIDLVFNNVTNADK